MYIKIIGEVINSQSERVVIEVSNAEIINLIETRAKDSGVIGRSGRSGLTYLDGDITSIEIEE